MRAIKLNHAKNAFIFAAFLCRCVSFPTSDYEEEVAYIKALQPNTVWKIKHSCCCGPPVVRETSQEPSYNWVISGEKIFEGKKYSYITGNLGEDHYKLLLRESEGRIYQYLNGRDTLVYDISLNIGDTCLGREVSNIDTMHFIGFSRKVVRLTSFNYSRTWIEGVCPLVYIAQKKPIEPMPPDWDTTIIVVTIGGGCSYYIAEMAINGKIAYINF
jgi:hypothetical protein